MNTPQYADEQLNAALGRNVVVKVETANPLRSFKGRGADFFMGRVDPRSTVVCSSTGNFGQAMAYAGRRRGIAVEVFVPENVNPVKLARMRAFGARVTPVGADSAASEAAARDYVAGREGCVYVEDGKEVAIAEGAGTIGVELIQAGPFDAVVLPVGDGALITGVARWIKDRAPQTRIIGVCASGAPCMALSWRAGKPVSTERSDTIAEGIEVRVPVPESVDPSRGAGRRHGPCRRQRPARGDAAFGPDPGTPVGTVGSGGARRYSGSQSPGRAVGHGSDGQQPPG